MAGANDPFEQCAPPATQRQGKKAATQPAGPHFKILVASSWHNEHTGASGTSWTDAGVAFLLRDRPGMKLRIKGGIAISGDVMILPADESSSYQG